MIILFNKIRSDGEAKKCYWIDDCALIQLGKFTKTCGSHSAPLENESGGPPTLGSEGVLNFVTVWPI